MNHRFIACAGALAVSLTYVSGFSRTLTYAQTPSRTVDGQSNLQGIWTNATITPLERPAELAGKEFFTEKEAAEYEKQMRERNNGDRRDSNAEADLTVGYNDVWWD